ncbi:anthranilate synthase component I [Ignisphaera sp. 4213-co]|uniref:anthranilate synthase n=1 Tax=Ignisphaera cupida TaxID=3050454 RepID=A0ABD4Z636_9CREN|nr:anthranilate synthase component I [Ignisphaera sp. 4213-co]MDK6028083.1 anthranilate synthase component I [Ignisphaera sp. 4213-co]
MEIFPLKSMLSVEEVVKCFNNEEKVFAVYENLSRNSSMYSIVAWGVRSVVSGSDEDVLNSLRSSLEKTIDRRHLYPFDIGLIGYVSYDAVRLWEKVPDLKPHAEEWPFVEMFEPINIAVYDYSKGVVYVDGDSSELKKCRKSYALEMPRVSIYDSMLDGEKFVRAVEEVLKHIRDGYAFQVVISRFLRYAYAGDLADFYIILRRVNPSPHTYFMKFGDKVLIGASPELLYACRNRFVETYPIAGTRPRGATPEEDRALEEELIKSEKDRAEHLMLVDLARNDLGKVCEFGSVKVEKFMYVEKYSHVQHIVSKVVGVLKRKYTSVDLLKAMLPAGTVSGAPKPFAMRLIEEVEDYKRGPYAGAVGFFTTSGDSVAAIAIRTAFVYKDLIRIQAGAGIVYDSNPWLELEETDHKLAALKKALGVI